jgi:hypothetical protein
MCEASVSPDRRSSCRFGTVALSRFSFQYGMQTAHRTHDIETRLTECAAMRGSLCIYLRAVRGCCWRMRHAGKQQTGLCTGLASGPTGRAFCRSPPMSRDISALICSDSPAQRRGLAGGPLPAMRLLVDFDIFETSRRRRRRSRKQYGHVIGIAASLGNFRGCRLPPLSLRRASFQCMHVLHLRTAVNTTCEDGQS